MKWLREQKDPKGKFGRWLLELEEFNYEIVSRNGLEHVVPDCLSRSTFTERDAEIMNDEQFFENRIFAVNCESNEVWLSRVHDMQLDDPAIRLARQQLHTNNEIREGRYKRFKLMHVDKGILMRGRQVVVPNNLRYEITKECHESTGHLGEAGTLAAVSEKYVWSGMQGYISDYCKHCTCIRNKASRKMKEPLQPYELDDLKPRCVIAFDVGVLPWATDSYRYFLVIVDLFSKYIEVAPMKNQQADNICKALTNYWIYRHGKPRIAVSDQAKNIDGTMVYQLCDKLGIEKRRSSTYPRREWAS